MQTENRTALDTLYMVNDSDNTITLEVITGPEGQTSDTTIEIDDATIAENHAGNFPSTEIGSNKALEGKLLTVICNIADTSQDTNFTEMKVLLGGGISDHEFPLSATVDSPGDSVNYTCIIKFFKP